MAAAHPAPPGRAEVERRRAANEAAARAGVPNAGLSDRNDSAIMADIRRQTGGTAGGSTPPTAAPATPAAPLHDVTRPIIGPKTPGTTTPNPAATDPNAPNEADRQNAIDYVRSLFPWLDQLGLVDQIRQWVTEGARGDAIVARVRSTSQWAGRFVGIKRDDGTLRMNEAAYLGREDDYRTLLKQFGKYDKTQDTPASYQAFFASDIDPNELKDRLTTYDQIDRSSDDVKAAFYVYAGMKVTTDDLYNATVVDRNQGASLQREYDRRVALQPLDYATWITRATEAGLDQVTSTLQRLQSAGVVGGDAVSQIARVDPTFARDVMTALHQGTGLEGTTGHLDLSSLMNAFQYALLGSAATTQGLAIPGTARLEALRQAGVTRSQALDAYGQIANNQTHWNSAAERANLGPLDQADFEQALLLHQADPTEALRHAISFDESLKQSSGGAAFRQQGARIAQPGLYQSAA